MPVETIEIGKTYTQSTGLVDQTRQLRVVTLNTDTVWYKIGHKQQIHRMTLERFKEIVGASSKVRLPR